MLELIGSAIVFWLVWKALDFIFTKKPKPHGKRFAIQDRETGEYYIVEEQEAEQQEQQDLPDNVVKFPKGKRHG